MIILFVFYIYGCAAAMMITLMVIDYMSTPNSFPQIDVNILWPIILWPITLGVMILYTIFLLTTDKT